MAYNEELAQRIRTLVVRHTHVSEKRMFGGLAFLWHGHMFVGIVGDDLMARIGKPQHAAALAQPHVRTMDFTGKPMAGYVFVAPAALVGDSELTKWVGLCEAFVSTLPPKALSRSPS